MRALVKEKRKNGTTLSDMRVDKIYRITTNNRMSARDVIVKRAIREGLDVVLGLWEADGTVSTRVFVDGPGSQMWNAITVEELSGTVTFDLE